MSSKPIQKACVVSANALAFTVRGAAYSAHSNFILPYTYIHILFGSDLWNTVALNYSVHLIPFWLVWSEIEFIVYSAYWSTQHPASKSLLFEYIYCGMGHQGQGKTRICYRKSSISSSRYSYWWGQNICDIAWNFHSFHTLQWFHDIFPF